MFFFTPLPCLTLRPSSFHRRHFFPASPVLFVEEPSQSISNTESKHGPGQLHYYYELCQGVLFDWTGEIEQKVQESEVGACQALLFSINTNFSKLQCVEEPHDSKG